MDESICDFQPYFALLLCVFMKCILKCKQESQDIKWKIRTEIAEFETTLKLIELVYLLAEDGADGPLHLCRVLNIHRPHMGLTNVHLSIGMLRGQLQTTTKRLGKTNTPSKSHMLSRRVKTGCASPRMCPPPLTSLSVGFPLKKSVFLLLFGGLNLGLRKAQPLAMASRGAGPS